MKGGDYNPRFGSGRILSIVTALDPAEPAPAKLEPARAKLDPAEPAPARVDPAAPMLCPVCGRTSCRLL